jgi:hypothetical protein
MYQCLCVPLPLPRPRVLPPGIVLELLIHPLCHLAAPPLMHLHAQRECLPRQDCVPWPLRQGEHSHLDVQEDLDEEELSQEAVTFDGAGGCCLEGGGVLAEGAGELGFRWEQGEDSLQYLETGRE